MKHSLEMFLPFVTGQVNKSNFFNEMYLRSSKGKKSGHKSMEANFRGELFFSICVEKLPSLAEKDS